MDVVRIRGLELDCIVGLRPQERVSAQRLRVDLELGVDTREAGRTGRIKSTLDYDRIAADVVALLQFRRYQLIEVATEELSAMLLGAYPPAQSVRLCLEKPGALAGRAEAASIETHRTRDDFQLQPQRALGEPDLLLRTRDAELWVIELASGDHLRPAQAVRVLQRVVLGQLFAEGGQVWPAGLTEPATAAHDNRRSWHSNGTETRVFRCCVRSHDSPQDHAR